MTNRTLLTGGTGTLGTALRPRLRDAGDDVRATSRSPPTDSDDIDWVAMDLAEGNGDPRGRRRRRHRRPHGDCPQGTLRPSMSVVPNDCEEAAADADVSNVVYVSIVGVDEIPYSYYEQKHAVEQTVAESDIPSTIVRATQFHSFVADLLETASRLPVWPLPTGIRLQPIDVGEVADAIVDHATTLDAAGRVPDIGGPEVRTVGDLARTYRDARGLRRPIVRLPIPGKTAAAFRAGGAICRTGPSER